MFSWKDDESEVMENETRDVISLPFKNDGHAQCVALTFIYQQDSLSSGSTVRR